MSPMAQWLLVLTTTGLLVYYGAIISGVFKEPLLAEFRKYGRKGLPSPLLRLLQSLTAWCVVMALVLTNVTGPSSYSRRVFPPVIFLVLGGMALGVTVVVMKRPNFQSVMPRWYAELLRETTLQERRFIGFAWLRIPLKMRWRLNGDQAAFRTWADTVRITVIYGAFDPNNPWDLWN